MLLWVDVRRINSLGGIRHRDHDSTIIRNLASSNGRFSEFWCTHWYSHESGVITTGGGESGCGDGAPVLKTGRGLTVPRGFESPPSAFHLSAIVLNGRQRQDLRRRLFVVI